MLRLENIKKTFNPGTVNEKCALQGLSLHLKPGDFATIIGSNGAGKSTMMNMLYGLLQPTSGKILIRGKEVTLNSPVDAIANGIGMVHQHFKLVPSLTVYENISVGCGNYTEKKAE